MNEIEWELQSQRLAAPSAELDQRIAESFAAAREPRWRVSPLFRWWAVGAALAAGIAVALFFPGHSAPIPPPRAVVYQVEAQGLLREMLLNPSLASEEPLPFAVQTPSP